MVDIQSATAEIRRETKED